MMAVKVTVQWTYADAIYLAQDMLRAGQIKFADLDKTVTELWQELQAENEAKNNEQK